MNEMADAEQLERLKRSIDGWNQWRRQQSADRPDLSNADLSITNLGNAHLRSTNLSGADLRPIRPS